MFGWSGWSGVKFRIPSWFELLPVSAGPPTGRTWKVVVSTDRMSIMSLSVTPTREGLVISPADGVVHSIEMAVPPEELAMGETPRTRVAVFMNVFDVHVNRAPVDGTITGAAYRPGKFLNASLDKASEFNERQSLKITTADGRDVAFIQIAGLVARRILCEVSEGDQLKAGERFGMIRFGSRVDVYLPDGVEPLVALGQTAIAGETVLADLNGAEAARAGRRG